MLISITGMKLQKIKLDNKKIYKDDIIKGTIPSITICEEENTAFY
jgi:hypothetical protein